MIKVLEGVRVIEQGTFITGPAASMMLADLGADVIKVEQPVTGDPFRAFKGGLYSPHFQTYNRNKRSITLDLKQDADRETFDALIGGADVYIQNFRPGVAEQLGAGEQRLRALNARLIYCAISGFGASGPAAQRPCYDTVAQAASAFLGLLINPANPRVVGPAIADAVTGLYAAYGILGALYERSHSGHGRTVAVSMLEAMAHFNLDAFTHYYSAGEVMGPYSRPSVSQSYVLRCADDKWIALHMSSPEKFWNGLAVVIGQSDLLSDARFATRRDRIANQEELIRILSAAFATQRRDEWCRRLQAHDVPNSPVYDSSEALEDPQARHLQLLVAAEHPTLGTFRTVRSPVSFDGQRALEVVPPPLLGASNAEIRQSLGRRAAGGGRDAPAGRVTDTGA
jgi:crotonobetainyl-CoA:carnitine CoA-transferase CaiB-like acyl-CoA transferase